MFTKARTMDRKEPEIIKDKNVTEENFFDSNKI